MHYDVASRSRTIIVAVMLLIGGSTAVFAAVDSGIDTPSGVKSLPLSVQGIPGCTLETNKVDATQAPTMTCVGQFIEGGATINPDGSTVIGSNANGPSSTVLTVNGDMTILGTATNGSDCSGMKLGTISQDGTGKILSCQATTGSNGQTVYVWQSAFGGTCASAQVAQALSSCTGYNYSAFPGWQPKVSSLSEGQVSNYDWVGPACGYGSATTQMMQCINGNVIPINCGYFACNPPPAGG